MRALFEFLESRLGAVSLWRASMIDKRPPRGIGWLRTLGFCALTIAMLQLLSGLALALHYVPSADLAYDSIRAFEQDVPLGRFVRALHHFGASAFVIVAALHLLRVFFTGAYKRPRELTWLTGIGLLLVVLGFGFTGYLLPWDQKAYFATKVGTEIAAKTPLLGAELRTMLDGGSSVGPPTLTRFYVIHVVALPLALLGLLALHLWLIQRHGVAPPGRAVDDPGEPGAPYFPHHVFKEAVAGVVIAGALFWLAATQSAPLEAIAEPSETDYQPRPDWYFLGLFQLLKLFAGPLEPIGAFWLPNVLLAGAILLPFLDRNPQRHWRRRKVALSLGAGIVLGALGLTIAGALDAPQNPPTLRHPLGLTHAQKEGYLLVRRLRCLDCHAYQGIGGAEEHPDAPHLDELDHPVDDLAAILEDPAAVLGNEDTEMPDFAHVPLEQRRAIGLYLRRLIDGPR
jgi:ubiquinol-cytochrome c reductase cytochrome b subunit